MQISRIFLIDIRARQPVQVQVDLHIRYRELGSFSWSQVYDKLYKYLVSIYIMKTSSKETFRLFTTKIGHVERKMFHVCRNKRSSLRYSAG